MLNINNQNQTNILRSLLANQNLVLSHNAAPIPPIKIGVLAKLRETY